MTEETTEIIEVTPAPDVMQMPIVSPLLLPFMLPFMLMQQMMLAMTQMTVMPTMSQPQAQQTVVKLGYDKDGNITSVYERRW